jgi:hypothetical protein
MSAAQHELSLWEIVTKVFYAIFFWGYLDSLPDEVPQHIHFEFIFWAIRMGMSPNAAIPLNNGTSLPLPCYLAHKRQLPLLCRLLRDGAISFSGCDKIWPWVKLSVQEIEPLYELMKYASPSPAFSKWLCANPSLVHPLADMLTYDSTCRPMVINERRRLDSAQWKAAAEAREAEAKAVEAKEKAEKKAMEELVQSLCAKPPAEARAYVEKHTKSPQLIRVAVHHGFLDLISSFIPRSHNPRQTVFTAPACSVPSRYKLSPDSAANAWLWLIKGDGNVDQKRWVAILASGLVADGSAACQLLGALYKGGDKITTRPLFTEQSGCTSLLPLAVQNGNNDAVLGLIQSKVDVNTAGSDGQCALHAAACQPDGAAMVKALLSAGASVNCCDSRGNSALHYARDTSVAKLLVEHKADILRRNHANSSPMDRDYKNSHRFAVIDYLRAVYTSEQLSLRRPW